MSNWPSPALIVTATIRFLTPDEGGRRWSLQFPSTALYRPGIVVQDKETRQALMKGNEVLEVYTGVTFLDGPSDYALGNIGTFQFVVHYWPKYPFSELVPGAEFTIREGARVVAGGTILTREERI